MIGFVIGALMTVGGAVIWLDGSCRFNFGRMLVGATLSFAGIFLIVIKALEKLF